MFGKPKWDALESALSDVDVESGKVREPIKAVDEIDGNGNNIVVERMRPLYEKSVTVYKNGFTDGVGNVKQERPKKADKPQCKKVEKPVEESKVTPKTTASKPEPRTQSFSSWEAEHGYHSTNDGFNIYSND